MPSAQELFEEVVVTPRRAFPALRDLRVIERPGWLQTIAPSFATSGLNKVIFSALGEHAADATIDATIAEYRELRIEFRWNVAPGSAPADLGDRLERRGLVSKWVRGVARSTRAPARPGDPAIRIVEVDATTIESFAQVMASGWSFDLAAVTAVQAQILTAPDRRHRLYLAYYDGEPAATASYVGFPRSVHLAGGVVLPQFRGRGLYRALVEARLTDAQARGIELATCYARETSSAPILERIGFETICRFPVYIG